MLFRSLIYVRDLNQSKWVAIGGVNFATADLTATGDRYHNFAGNTLTVDNLNNLGFVNYNTNFQGGIYLNNTGPKLIASVYPNGMHSRINMDTSFVEILSFNSNISPTIGSKILLDTNYIQFQYLGSPDQYYYFPNTNPTAGTVMGYTSANTLGWVDISPAFDDSVDLTSTDYTIQKWGVYTVIATIGSYNINFPDPKDFPGNYITIINKASGSDIGIGGDTPFDRGESSNITSLAAKKMLMAYSDGNQWLGFIQ